MNIRWWIIALMGVLFVGAACDSVLPASSDLLVVEGYLESNQPLPSIRIQRARMLSQSDERPVAVTDADLVMRVQDDQVRYEVADSEEGRYEPSLSERLMVNPGDGFSLSINWEGQQVQATGVAPKEIAIHNMTVDVPDQPIEAILVDTLRLDTLQVDVRKGYIYPVEVSLSWEVGYEETGLDSLYWIHTALRPKTAFSSTILDFFLLTEEVFFEQSIALDENRIRRWKGIYAVPVDSPTDPMPAHELAAHVLRSSEEYALFALSSDAPTRREPLTNLDGAVGIVTAIARDSTSAHVGGVR